MSKILLTVCFVCVVNLFCSWCANGCMLFCFVCVVNLFCVCCALVVLYCDKNIGCYPLQRQKRRNWEHELCDIIVEIGLVLNFLY